MTSKNNKITFKYQIQLDRSVSQMPVHTISNNNKSESFILFSRYFYFDYSPRDVEFPKPEC